MYKINFNHLHYFLTIAKEGSIVKASKKLHVTQPALSHQLKLLELDLGKKLFDRVGRRLVLNTDGIAVKEYANKIFRHSEEMLQYLKSNSTSVVKIIKIGAVPWISKDQTYDFLKPLIINKHIKVEVYQKDLETLIKDIQAGRLDIILCDSPYSGRSKKLIGHKLTDDPIICVCSSKKGIKGRFPQCIKGKKIINYSEACITADKIDEFIHDNDLSLNTVCSFTDSALIRVTIEKGGVIGFLPLSVVKQSLRNKSLVKLGVLTEIKSSLWAITQKDYGKDSLVGGLLYRNKIKKKV